MACQFPYEKREVPYLTLSINRYEYLEGLEKKFESLAKEKALVEESLVESRRINSSLEEDLIVERKAVINLSKDVERLNIIKCNQEARMLSMGSISEERWRRADKFKKEADELTLRLSSYITRNYDLSTDVSKAKCELGKAKEEIATLKLELEDVTEKHEDAVSHLLLAVKLSGDIEVSEHVYDSRGDRDGEVVIFKDTASGVCKLHYEPKKVMVPKTEEDMELEDIYDKIEVLKRRRQTIYALKEHRENK
jgi:hypothetical protein